MKKLISQIFREIRLQLTDTPAYATKIDQINPKKSPELESIAKQIAKALDDPTNKLIFLIAPSGAGKTTQVCYFLQRHRKQSYLYKSFVKIRSVDFAFLHLTNFWGRFAFLIGSMGVTYFIAKFLGVTDALPLLLTAGYFFTKNAPNLLYIFHETIHDLLHKRSRLIVIEDLEKGSLCFNDQWAFLANLWLSKRTYLVSLGYSVDDKTEKLKILESAMKLEGTIIEIPITKEKNISIIQNLDPDFPFAFSNSEEGDEWISLFTPQELLMVHEQVQLQLGNFPDKQKKEDDKTVRYIKICLDLLTKKLGMEHDSIYFDRKEKTVQGVELEALAKEKAHYIHSFIRSMSGSLRLKSMKKSISH